MPMDAPTLARTAVPFIAPSLDLRRLWRNLLERLGDLRTWMLHRAAEPHGPDIAEERTLHAERRIRQTHLEGPAFLAAHGLVLTACRPVGLVAVLDVEH